MLDIAGIDCFHGDAQALHGFTLAVDRGEVMCLLGRNGAGKTTALKAIMGLVPVRRGAITLDGVALTSLPPHEVPRQGVGYVPQGRRLFADLTVRENLEIGLMARGTGRAALDRALDTFPLLKERLGQKAGTMSGGQQQMLAMARALCLEPKLLLLDEPTEGLMPSMIARIREAVMALKASGVTTLLVEQRVDAVMPVADRVGFVENGRVTAVLPVGALAADRGLVDRHVGLGD